MHLNALPELGKALQYGSQYASALSSSSQRTTRSSQQYNHMTLPGQWTEPTSQPSDSFEIIGKGSVAGKHEEAIYTQPGYVDSDREAQYGSDSIHSWGSTESSLDSLDDSRKDLPQLTRDFKMKEIGGHFAGMIPQGEEPSAVPQNDNAARFMMDKIKSACDTNRAADNFESHLQPDSAPELSIQRDQILGSWVKRRMQPIHTGRDPPMVDIEEQRPHCLRNRKGRATIFLLALVFVFIAVTLSLYANIRIAR